MKSPWHPDVILAHQSKISSQNGEDGVLLYLLSLIDAYIPCWSFEVGAGIVNGNLECNTAILLNNGWFGIIADIQEIRHPFCIQKRITPDNINECVSHKTGVLSIDVDGNDYWIWKAVEEKPAIVIIEYNSHLDPTAKLVQPYSNISWDGSDFFGASAGSLEALGIEKGYKLVVSINCLNLFFVRKDLWEGRSPDLRHQMFGPVRRHPTYQGDRKYLTL